MNRLFRKKAMISHPVDAHQLKSCLTATDLTLLGIGAVIGAGIFVLTGIAAATAAGPAIVISFIIAGLACGFAAFSYAELSASVGGCGSAYHYAYVSMGELPAWIIGWDLLLEYALSVSAVAVGWSRYFNSILESIGLSIPAVFLKCPSEGGIANLPAMFIVFFIAILLSIGAKTSARFNGFMVLIKLSVVVLFAVIASMHVQPVNWHPFMPFGWHGVMSGAALIFFAYIGFDAVSTTAEEVINPQRDLPIGIIASLGICTVLYIVVSVLLTGILPYHELNVASPISYALMRIGYHWSSAVVAIGAIAGITTVILVMYYGLTRVFLSMARDHLLPAFFSKVHPTTRTPVRIILIMGFFMGCISGLVPIHDLAELVNIGTLAAFVIVCAGVIILRHLQPNMHRPFKTPFSPLIPALGIIFCLALMISLPVITWIRFGIWMTMGFVLYFAYSQYCSKLNA